MSKLDDALIQRNKEAMQQASPLFDELNKAWTKIEVFFRKQGILRDACLSIGSIEQWTPGGPEDVAGRLIGVVKVSGKWRVCYGIEHYHHPGDEINWTPVADCGTELRMELLEHVGDELAGIGSEGEAVQFEHGAC